MRDSKLWEQAYKEYKSSHKGKHLNRSDWQKKIYSLSGNYNKVNRVKIKDKIRPSVAQVSREFNSWKKTEGYKKWVIRQFLKQGGTCFYCDIPLRGIKQNVEHIVPRSKGGTNAKSNLVLACWQCNEKKRANLVPAAQLKAHRIRNKKKRGTFHLLKEDENYMSDEEFAFVLKERLRED